ncbi:MAG: ribonuclease III [Firmicutes bacterium]|nr:ribonuclease III [Bacillota bacterium]
MILQNGLTLAYIGDAYFELKIRRYLLDKGITKVNELHQEAIKFTQASGQAKAIFSLLDDFLNPEEIAVYKRGRNMSSTHKPKNADLTTYRHATGFEAMLGYLYLQDEWDRLEEIMKRSIEIIEEL